MTKKKQSTEAAVREIRPSETPVGRSRAPSEVGSYEPEVRSTGAGVAGEHSSPARNSRCLHQ